MDFNEIFERFSGLKKSQRIQNFSSYHASFFKLVSVTCSGHIAFFLGFLLTKNVKALFFKTAKGIFKFFISNESLRLREVSFCYLDFR